MGLSTVRDMSNEEHSRTASVAVLPWPDLFQITWQALSQHRHALHMETTGQRCPTPVAPYGRDDPDGRRTHSLCRDAGCIDLYHDVVMSTREKLDRHVDRHGATSMNGSHGYAYGVVSSVLSDRGREQRVLRGWPAKPGRSDGRPGRVITALAAEAGDPVRAAWLEALIRMIREYAHKSERTSSQWPLDGWGQEKTKHDGIERVPSGPTRLEIRSDIAQVLRTATEVLGATWVHISVYHPLMTALRPTTLDPAVPAVEQDLEEDILRRWLLTEYSRRRRQGDDQSDALAVAVKTVSGRELPYLDREVLALLRDIDRDLNVVG